jgi:hypothetical protein
VFPPDRAPRTLRPAARSKTRSRWPLTTKLYDRTGDETTLDEVERITI